MTKVILPELGEGIETATVSYWYFQQGDKVNDKEDLVELATDKATFNLPSSCAGILAKINVKEGESVKIGDVLAEIE
ncbi:MAG: lipoyl domain-containing protein [Candidatus Omnitrophota bacterium]